MDGNTRLIATHAARLASCQDHGAEVHPGNGGISPRLAGNGPPSRRSRPEDRMRARNPPLPASQCSIRRSRKASFIQ